MTAGSVAIVGMACRYPDAGTPAELWQTVLDRRTGFRLLPESRLGADYRGDRGDPDRTYVTHAGLIRDWEFDRERFGIPGSLFRAADLTHWLTLQTAADVLADAGFHDGEGLDGERAGVLIGNSLTGEFTRAATVRHRLPYVHRAGALALSRAGVPPEQAQQVLAELDRVVKQTFVKPSDESLAGALSNTIAGRVCNYYDFHGTGYTVDGACSSSLLAVMTACRALRDRELDFAIAGGVDLSLDPLELVGFARLGALAVDEMRIFDDRPSGFLPGEGCGLVALMRSEDADRLGLRVYARVIGWGTSSDGSGGLTRPSVDGQFRALARAYDMAGVDPATVALIEGHGTGTAVGDQVELAALRKLRTGTPPAALGSVKANIGHSKAAAGIAGLIKAGLALHNRILPPTTGCERPHELLRDGNPGLRVLTTAEPWTDAVPHAAVSAFGFSGINAHVVLQGEPGHPTPVPGSGAVTRWSATPPPHDIVMLAGRQPAELADQLATLAEWAPRLSVAELHDLAATCHHAYRSGPVRSALVAARPEELAVAASRAIELLAEPARRVRVDKPAGAAVGVGRAVRVGLLFPGQAAPVRAALPDWARSLDIPAAIGVKLRDGDVGTAVAQPAILRQSLAGIGWLDALGCSAVAAAGHSLGEITALVWAGALTAEQGLELASQRGRLMAEHGTPGTTMASIAADADITAELLARTDVVIAGYNGPRQTTVAGRTDEVREVLARAARRDIAGTELAVSHGFHSPAMRPVAEPFRAVLGNIRFGALRSRVVSTTTGEPISASDELAELLLTQLGEPVRFAQAVARLAGECDLLVEAGPGGALSRIADAGDLDLPSVSLDCGGDPRALALATAVLAAGDATDSAVYFAGRSYRHLPAGMPISLLDNPCEQVPELDEPVVVEAASPEQPAKPAEFAGETDTLTALRGHLARVLELPAHRIEPDTRLVDDLHLNSLQLIQVVAAVALSVGRLAPAVPPNLTEVTLADLANLIDALPDARPEQGGLVAGVRPWVRCFEHRWVPADVRPGPQARGWRVDAPGGHWLHGLASTGAAEPAGLAVAVPDGAGTDEIARLLTVVAAAAPARLCVIHNGHAAAAAIARSAVAELAGCAATVIELGTGDRLADLGVAGDSGYQELRRDADGGWTRLVTEPRDAPGDAAPPGELGLAEGEVLLVTGGVRGITAFSVAELAAAAGAALVVLGRSAPDDPAVLAGLDRLRERVTIRYVRCDVTDAESVASAAAEVARYGTVAGLVHGAGVNEPRRMRAVEPASLAATLAPKVDGLRHLLDVFGGGLRLLLAYGSIIGRCGLSGQSEYCVANDWMRHEVERWAAAHPHCRSLLLEWSVWSELGMGVRMDVLDDLHRQGVEPISAEGGVRVLAELLADPAAPVTTLITGRYPAVPTLALPSAGRQPAGLRFAEEPSVHIPGVESVLESVLSAGSDPYLEDHRLDGTGVFPAVLGLEAMAQAATVLRGQRAGWVFRDVAFTAPITVPDLGRRTIRVAALAERDAVEVVLRDDSDSFAADRFRATIGQAAAPLEGSRHGLIGMANPQRSQEFYTTVLFHGGRFQRLINYEWLSAFQVRAWVDARPDERWFSEFHGADLILGDPGMHDASIHVLLGCVPHRRALPTGVDELTVWRTASGPVLVTAEERGHTADDYVFDVRVTDREGGPVSAWHGLRLRAVGSPRAIELPARAVGPYLARRLIECGLSDEIDLALMPDARTTPHAGGSGEGLVAISDRDVAVAWAPSDIGGTADSSLIADIAAATGEQLADARVRAFVAGAAFARLDDHDGHRPSVDLVTDDGLVVVRSGGQLAVTARVRLTGGGAPVTAVVAFKEG